MLLTEHGIYTREREEEIIRAKWVQPAFKKQWISFFYMLSDIIYTRAFLVSALFTNAMHAQIQMGCDKEKCRVVENGINYERLSPIPLKEEDGWVDIGAIVRLAPIKDIKTMIYAFYELCTTREHVRLHIMGGVDDEEYAQECYALVDQLRSGKCDLYRTSGYHFLYGEAGLYNFDEYIGRTAAVCFRIICCKAALCDYRCRMLQGTSEW